MTNILEKKKKKTRFGLSLPNVNAVELPLRGLSERNRFEKSGKNSGKMSRSSFFRKFVKGEIGKTAKRMYISGREQKFIS